MSRATTNKDQAVSDVISERLDEALGTATEEEDEYLRSLTRDEAMKLGKRARLRWFFHVQLIHKELERISMQLSELLDPNNETRIITLIGPTGNGKTTLAFRLVDEIVASRSGVALSGEVPVIYVRAPANGQRSMSWAGLYGSILRAGNEPALKRTRNVVEEAGHLKLRGIKTLDALRDALERMLKHRKVKLLIIDEALHMLRWANYSAVMDTLKSLGDAGETKLLLMGDYTLVEAATQYGQVARRSELLHYTRYQRNDAKHKREFAKRVQRLETLWPCEDAPAISKISEELMEASLGSIGLLKSLLLKAAFLQMERPDEKWDISVLAKAAKSRKLLQTIEREIVAGEAAIAGHTYGESLFESEEVLTKLAQKMVAING